MLGVPVEVADLPPEQAALPPSERGPRGAALWEDLAGSLPPAQRLMLDEACRMADRLDRLDGLLHKRSAWLTFETEDGGRVVVVVDAVLAEARQYATALRGLLGDITKALPKASQVPASQSRGSSIASLADAASRRRSATG